MLVQRGSFFDKGTGGSVSESKSQNLDFIWLWITNRTEEWRNYIYFQRRLDDAQCLQREIFWQLKSQDEKDIFFNE